jgi:hypothetical protein
MHQDSESVKSECHINGWTGHGPITVCINVLNYEPLLLHLCVHSAVEIQATFLRMLEPWDRRLWFTVMIYHPRSNNKFIIILPQIA